MARGLRTYRPETGTTRTVRAIATALTRTRGEGINACKMVLKEGEKEGRVDGQKPEKYRGYKPLRNS